MSQGLSQGSQNSASSANSRRSAGNGGGKPPVKYESPFLKKRGPAGATNLLKVWHINPDANIPGEGAVTSGILLTCNGQFEQKANEILYKRALKPEYKRAMERLGCFDLVMDLGIEDSPMIVNGWQKKALLWLSDESQSREQVKDFVMNFVVPTVQEYNPVSDGRYPVWDDNHTYTRVHAFDQVIDHMGISKIVQKTVADPTTPYNTPQAFYLKSKKNLYSMRSIGSLSFDFKTSNHLTNAQLDPLDHFPPLDENGNRVSPNQQNPVMPGGNGEAGAIEPVQLAAAVEAAANAVNNNDPLANDPLEDSGEEEGKVEEPPRRRRRIN